MAEYISREAYINHLKELSKLLELDLNNPFEDGVRIGIERAIMEADNFSAADVRPVVLCKDCEWYEINELKKDGTEDRRYKPSVCMLAEQRREPNHFCADGKKREKN